MTTPQVSLKRVFLKNASLEVPGAPVLFGSTPAVSGHTHMDLHLNVQDIGDSHFEVTVRATLTLSHKLADDPNPKALAVVECEQAGIFQLIDIPQEDMAGVLYVNCVQSLYSYLRPNVTDLMVRATLPPFHLPDVNFLAMFQQQQEQQQSAASTNKKLN